MHDACMFIVHSSDAGYLLNLIYFPPTNANDGTNMLVGNSNGKGLVGIIIVIG